MIRATPSSTRAFTLFPYTPLFRAPDVARRSRSRVVERRRLVREVQGARSDVSIAGEIVRRISKNGPQARVRSWSAGSGWYRSTGRGLERSEEHTSELQSLMRISYAVFCLKKNNKHITKPIRK